MPTSMDLLDPERPESLNAARVLLDRAVQENITYFPSPTNWRNEVLYFLLPDRFSDGKESSRTMLSREDIANLRQASDHPLRDWEGWAESGERWQGGTINGIAGKLGYLKELGITSVWIGPLYKQRARENSYHGYGIQDFLEIDPRFGTREELINLVREAHNNGIRIILDVIVNHSGDNWGYVPPNKNLDLAQNEPPFVGWPVFYGSPDNAETRDWKLAWRNESQAGFTTDSSEITERHEGVWPRELQEKNIYTRAGFGDLGESRDISDPRAEHKRTDFLSLKDFALDVSPTLSYLITCFQYWIALTDCDGFRIDTVKHMALEETRNFCGAIREFTDMIGKHNFLLIGEIAGGDYYQDMVMDYTALMERNLNAALDIGSARLILQNVAKGLTEGKHYFNIFQEQSAGFESHRSFGDRHVSILDDHDHVFGSKIRFSAEIPDEMPVKDYQIVVATALQLFTLGIPCLYYGSEQAFAGPANSQVQYLAERGWRSNDRYLRECLFGPEHPRANITQDLEAQLSTRDMSLPGFGPFGTSGQHCFDSKSPAFVRISSLCKIRAAHSVLRLGRQYLRQVQLPGTGFVFPKAGEVVAWSRILHNQEAVCIVNPNGLEERGGDIVVSAELSLPGTEYLVVANTHQIAQEGIYDGSHPVGSKLTVKGLSNAGEPAFIEVRNLQPAEVLVLIREG